MSDIKIFTTEKIARILMLPEWRVVRFAQTPAYGIIPAFGQASGSGSRRLYDLENVCEIALASWLLEAGLRIEVIGRVLKQIRKQGGLRHILVLEPRRAFEFYLGVIRKRKATMTAQEAAYVHNWDQLVNIFGEDWTSSVLVVPIGRRLLMLKELAEQEDKDKEENEKG